MKLIIFIKLILKKIIIDGWKLNQQELSTLNKKLNQDE